MSLVNRDEKPLVLVDFYADWCEPCKWLDKILEEIDSELSESTTVLKVDSESNTDLSAHFNLKSVPVLILFKDGKEVWRINGFLNGEELVEKINSFLVS